MSEQSIKLESGELNIQWFIDKLQLVNSTTNQTNFVIDLKILAEVFGYRPYNLKKLLFSSELNENLDYKVIFYNNDEDSRNDDNPCYPGEKVVLTVFGSKVLALLTKSKNGSEFLKYFTDAENKLRQLQSQSEEYSNKLKNMDDKLVKQEKLLEFLITKIDSLFSEVKGIKTKTKIKTKKPVNIIKF